MPYAGNQSGPCMVLEYWEHKGGLKLSFGPKHKNGLTTDWVPWVQKDYLPSFPSVRHTERLETRILMVAHLPSTLDPWSVLFSWLSLALLESVKDELSMLVWYFRGGLFRLMGLQLQTPFCVASRSFLSGLGPFVMFSGSNCLIRSLNTLKMQVFAQVVWPCSHWILWKNFHWLQLKVRSDPAKEALPECEK